MPKRLGRRFYRRPADELARTLLGCRMVRRLKDGTRLSGVIIEVEAYLGIQDQAAHTFGGRRTPRNEAMWGDGGLGYVYFTYGMHHCFNIVAQRIDQPEAVLVRALEPSKGLEAMRERRPKAKRDTDLCSGPAKLCAAMAIDRSLNAEDLVTSDRLWLETAQKVTDDQVVRTPRIGIDYAGDWVDRPLRFCVRGHPHLSRSTP
ncbi:MAG: DNA-3-methyladenine glycosylase [Phycisphaeraceae bacterium]